MTATGCTIILFITSSLAFPMNENGNPYQYGGAWPGYNYTNGESPLIVRDTPSKLRPTDILNSGHVRNQVVYNFDNTMNDTKAQGGNFRIQVVI